VYQPCAFAHAALDRLEQEMAKMTALTFPTNLYDGTGYLILGGGSILNGTYDAYDIGLDHVGFPSAWNARFEDDGREVVFEAAAVNGIQLTRKIYVPDDSGWARFLEIVTNTKSTAVTYSLNLNTNLGSDGSTYVVQTSSGDLTLDRKRPLDRHRRRKRHLGSNHVARLRWRGWGRACRNGAPVGQPQHAL
jgi:hypothetical protein